jgi:hypothetical protein
VLVKLDDYKLFYFRRAQHAIMFIVSARKEIVYVEHHTARIIPERVEE